MGISSPPSGSRSRANTPTAAWRPLGSETILNFFIHCIALMPLSQQMLPNDWGRLLSGLLAALLICAIGAEPVTAQQSWSSGQDDPWGSHEPADRDTDRPQNDGDLGGVPGWAAPSDVGNAPDSEWGSNGEAGDDIQMNAPAPPPPSDPSRIPLGGLEWLLVAGAGYAAHRLRDEKSEEDPDAEPLP